MAQPSQTDDGCCTNPAADCGASEGRAGANAKTHGLFSSKGRQPPVRRARLAELEALFVEAATGKAERECASELADLQALLEDIRLLRAEAWNRAFEVPRIRSERDRASHLFRLASRLDFTRDMAGQDVDIDMELAMQSVLGINDEPRRWLVAQATEQVSRHLLKLHNYEQRVLGRRRKVMRRWVRLQCDRERGQFNQGR